MAAELRDLAAAGEDPEQAVPFLLGEIRERCAPGAGYARGRARQREGRRGEKDGTY